MDSKQRTKFSATVLRWLQDPEKERMLRNLLVSPEAIQEEHKSEVETTRKKFSIFWGSTPAWAVIGMIAGVVASQWSLKVLFVVAWGVFFWEFIRVKVFEKRTTKIIGNGLAGVVLVLVFYTGWKVTPKPREAPTIDQQINAFAERFPWLSSRPTAGTPVFNIPSTPQHAHVEYLAVDEANNDLHNPLFVPQQGMVMIPIAFKNSGMFAVKEPLDCWILVLVLSAKVRTGFRDTEKQMKCSDGVSGSLPAGSPNGGYHTAIATLTDDDIEKLKLGTLHLCGFGKVRWFDDSGRYETRFAQCLEAESDKSMNWHNLKENNEEIKQP